MAAAVSAAQDATVDVVEVILPPGTVAGDRLSVLFPCGGRGLLVVPEGLGAGNTLKARLKRDKVAAQTRAHPSPPAAPHHNEALGGGASMAKGSLACLLSPSSPQITPAGNQIPENMKHLILDSSTHRPITTTSVAGSGQSMRPECSSGGTAAPTCSDYSDSIKIAAPRAAAIRFVCTPTPRRRDQMRLHPSGAPMNSTRSIVERGFRERLTNWEEIEQLLLDNTYPFIKARPTVYSAEWGLFRESPKLSRRAKNISKDL